MKLIPDPSVYAAAFSAALAQPAPVIDALEHRLGYALAPEVVTAAARVLACPVKAHPPNWHHGRLLYAVARAYLATATGPVQLLDIGTAKGFSALCLQWALLHAGVAGQVVSVDVIDPNSHARRNTVAECEGGLKTLWEILAPWPAAGAIHFLHATGLQWLAREGSRVHLAYIDGKHDYTVVRAETAMLAARQRPGDLVVWDDLQIPGVNQAVDDAAVWYAVAPVLASADRAYAIGTRR